MDIQAEVRQTDAHQTATIAKLTHIRRLDYEKSEHPEGQSGSKPTIRKRSSLNFNKRENNQNQIKNWSEVVKVNAESPINNLDDTHMNDRKVEAGRLGRY
ncbi:hypothetical protein JTB14_035758 [Gonioctena quinquepunctata]|nr:hypothetical protein JTB14_035758 [Gonioctena quinquepunctata]